MEDYTLNDKHPEQCRQSPLSVTNLEVPVEPRLGHHVHDPHFVRFVPPHQLLVQQPHSGVAAHIGGVVQDLTATARDSCGGAGEEGNEGDEYYEGGLFNK